MSLADSPDPSHSPSANSPLLGSRQLYTLPPLTLPVMLLPATSSSPSTSTHPTSPTRIPPDSTPALPLIPPSSPSSSHLPPSSSPPSDAAVKARASYLLGLVYLGLVIVLWVASSALIQWIFEQQGDAQPFFLTYFSTSLFTLYIPTYYALQACRRTTYQRITPDTAAPPASNGLTATGGGGLGAAVSAGGVGSPLVSLREHVHLALLLSPIWFLMEYLYNESLALTTLSQNTIISTTSGVFVLAFNYTIFRDPLTLTNLLGVAFTLAGAYLVYHDGTVAEEEGVTRASAMAGDVLALMAAVFYGLYTVTVKLKVKDDASVNWQLILGFLGLTNLALAWPLFFLLHWTRLEVFVLPSSTILASLLLNGLLGTVLADYLWARSILLTSPLVATMGLTLNIPCSLLVEWLWKGRGYGWTYVVGGLSVVVGFVLVNWREVERAKKEKVEEEEKMGGGTGGGGGAAGQHSEEEDTSTHEDSSAYDTEDGAEEDSQAQRASDRRTPRDELQVSRKDLQDEHRFRYR